MIVGIFGEAGVGKSTVAEMIGCRCGYVVVSFADELKRTAARWFGYTREQLWGSSGRRKERPPGRPELPTAREACQFLGTEVGRALYPDLWAEHALDIATYLEIGMPRASDSRLEYRPEVGVYVISGWKPPPRGVVIADGRFPNETTAISRAGGINVRIHRPGYGASPTDHASETSLSSIPDEAFNDVIENDGSMYELGQRVNRLIEHFEL
jgi:hypothetical protein